MNKDNDADTDMIERHVEALSEHFDTIMIFATKHEPTELGGTKTMYVGSGNWYARYGQIREWLVKQDERAKMHLHEEDDDETA